MKYVLAAVVLILLGVLVFGGCASSPDTWIYVDKSIHIKTATSVSIKYRADATVTSDAKLDGEVTTPITVTPGIP